MPLYAVAKVGEIPPGGRKLVTVARLTIGVFNVDGNLHAYRNICPHAGAPVCEGRITGTTLPSKVYEYNYGHEGCVLRCPWHGWEFDLRTGAHLVNPKTRLKKLPLSVDASAEIPTENLAKLPVECHGEMVFVELPH